MLSGLALGMESSVWAILVIAGSILSSVLIYGGQPEETRFTAILYGVSLTGIGMGWWALAFVAFLAFAGWGMGRLEHRFAHLRPQD